MTAPTDTHILQGWSEEQQSIHLLIIHLDCYKNIWKRNVFPTEYEKRK